MTGKKACFMSRTSSVRDQTCTNSLPHRPLDYLVMDSTMAGSILARQCLNCCLGCAARSHMPSKAIWRASNCMAGFRYPLPGTTWPRCSLQLGRQSKTIWTACFESRLYGTGSAETWAVDGCIRGLPSNTDPRSPGLL